MPLPGKQLAPIKPLAPSLPGAPLGAMSSAALPLMIYPEPGPAQSAEDGSGRRSNSEDRFMKRPGRPRVEPPARGTIDARTIRLNSRGFGSTHDAFAKAIGVSVKDPAQLGAGAPRPGPGVADVAAARSVAGVRCGQRAAPNYASGALVQRKNSYTPLSYQG